MTTAVEEKPIVSVDQWSVHDVAFTIDKIKATWELLQRHKTLFSDLTREDPGNFIKAIMSSNMLWYEVRDHGVLVGFIWFTDLHQVVDYTVHLVFFDRQPAEKLFVCKKVLSWMFKAFPVHRITGFPPEIYRATIRLMKNLGFEIEGTKRESVLIGGRWNNQVVMGITRTDWEAAQ